MKEMLETKIARVKISEDEHAIAFYTYWGPPMVYATCGECCSETWFADIIGLHNLFNQEIIGVRVLEVEIPNDDRRSRQEVDEAYGYRLTTRRGDCDFIFRNSSNGYYGGNLELVNKEHVNGLLAKMEFREITENDWTA